MDSPPAAAATRIALGHLDWRYLLPVPRAGRFDHLLLFGGGPGLAECIIELGIAQTVTAASDGDQQADAVVVLNGASVALSAVARRVRRGGVLYFEGRRGPDPAVSTARRVHDALTVAGLQPVGSWAVTPGFTERRAYLPFGVPGAFRWYVSTFRAPSTARDAVREIGFRALLATAGTYLSSLAPSFAVVAVADSGCPIVPPVLGDPGVAAIIGDEDLRTVLLTHGGDRVVLMPFRRADRAPVAVLKVPRQSAFIERTANEQRMLSLLRGSRDARLSEGAPRPLGLVPYGGVTVAVESFQAGRSILRSTRRFGRTLHRKLSDLREAARWLTDFHREFEVSRAEWGEADIASWIEGPLQLYGRAFGVTEAEAALFARSRSHASALAGLPFPLVWQHRDFKPSHVFRSGGRVVVIDWEGARPGPALCDLLHFVLHWHAAVRRVPGSEGLSRLLAGHDHDAVSKSVREALRGYIGGLSLDGRFVPLLLVYTCIELALRRADQHRLRGERSESPRAGHSEFQLVDVLARHVDELFRDSRPALVA